MPKKTFTAEEKAEYYKQQQADIKNMFEKIDKGVQDVFQSEKYHDYLKFCSMFTDYSANNTMLIALQKPDASLVASFKKWNQIGRNVERGSKGIEIFAPIQVKTNQYIEEERPVKDEFGNQEYNDDGTIKTETIEKPLKQLSFKKVYVFDVSQTSGKELPTFVVDELSGNIDKAKMDAILTGIKKAVDIPVDFENIVSGAKGYYSYAQNRIAINYGMSDVQTLKTAFHEAAHCLLHNPQRNINSKKTSHNDKEVQAESTAFIIANKYGIDTSEYSFPYIASWAENKDLSTLKTMLGDIQDAAREISNSIDNELLKLKKRDLSVDELISDTELNNVQKAEILIHRSKVEGVILEKNVTDEIINYAVKSENIREIVKKVDESVERQKQCNSYGYDFSNTNLIDSKENALAAFDKGEAVYLLYPDNTEGQALERSEIEKFSGMFGTEKEHHIEKNITAERNPELIQVSKENALSMYDKGLEIYVDGSVVEDRTEIQSALDHSIISVNQYQYAAELNFDKPNVEKNSEVRNNSSIIGNTPYKELGEKAYFKANAELSDKISEQLENSGIKYSGLRKTDSTTFTVNKKDIEQYKSVVSKITAASELVPEKPTAEKDKSNIIGNTSFKELVDVKKHTYKARVAENIIKELLAEGIKFSGLKLGATTVISVNGENENDFNSVVNKVKQNFIIQHKQKVIQPETETPKVSANTVTDDFTINENNKSFSLDIFTVQSFTEIKENNAVDQWRNEMDDAKACVRFIDENLSKSYENRALDEFTANLEEKFGLDKSMHILSATIQLKQHDGRFANDIKERASKYEFANDSRRIEFLTEQHPVMLNHLFQKMVEREHELKKIQTQPRLNNYFNNKHLLPVESFELKTDKRGFPQTVSKKSAINERFVEGYGWLDNEKYVKAMKASDNPADFSQKVSKVCVSYVDDNGRFGLADIDRTEYDVFTQKTYSLENKERYEAAKQKNEDFKSRYQGQQTEYYAVRQLSTEKYAIITLGSDGTPDFVKRDISKQDAIKAITDIYTDKTKNKIRCEIVQPDKIDKLSIEAYKNQNETERNPDIFYKVLPNPNKQVADRLSHFVQEYKKDGDSYKASAVTLVGTYDECHDLTEKLMKSEIEPTYKIYQLTDNYHDLSFEDTAYLEQHGIQPIFSNYKKVYEAALSDLSGSVPDCLEEIYTKFNMYLPSDFKGHSLSVSDVVVVDKDPYFVDSIGFKKLNGFTPEQTIEAMQEKFMNNFDDRLKNINSSEELKAFADEAKSLGIDCNVELNKSIAEAANIKIEKEIPMIKTQKRGI